MGTRGSLLALTQSRQILDQLERSLSLPLTIKTIVTRGDMEDRTPLEKMGGKDFFTKELDRSLLLGDVDLVVHSCKDLGSDRPEGIELGAIACRTYAHDILLCAKSTVMDLRKGVLTNFRVGTCSPRRSYYLENFLKNFLPHGKRIGVFASPLRGNVTTRIRQLVRGPFEGIVLALAGLERLAAESEMMSLWKKLDYMVLPRSVFVPAPAQGALAVEIRSDCPGDLRRSVEKLNHTTTREEVFREKSIFQSYGGGCQLAVGIHVQKKKKFFLVMEKGFHLEEGVSRFRLVGERPSPKGRGIVVGRPCDEFIRKTPCKISKFKPENENYAFMVTSSHCLNALEKLPTSGWLFSSGVRTHKRMAEKGYWVHLCADSLGEEEIRHLLESKALKGMGKPGKTYVLTGEGSISSIGSVLPCYQRKIDLDKKFLLREKLESVESFFWASFPQYQAYRDHFPFITDRQHACGLGKTWDSFLKEGIKVIPFANPEEFDKWCERGKHEFI